MHTGLTDTGAEIAAVLLDMVRHATPERRLALALSLSRAVVALRRDALARQRPEASDEEIGLQFVAQCYGASLADDVRTALAARRP
jgi:hypothetical protein